ncbi:unnamed protein product, partial [Oppiella nova]
MRNSNHFKITFKTKTFSDAFRLIQMNTDNKCRRFMKMCKNMSEFSELGKDDKIGLLIDGFPKILSLLSVLNFNFEGRFWTIPFEFKSDMIMFDLLSAVVLFNPNGSILTHKHFITLQQKIYMYLLQRYLEIKHNSKSESETRFLRLMNCVNELHECRSPVAHRYDRLRSTSDAEYTQH